jgi:hypothetical protein
MASMEGKAMKNILLAGTAGLLLAFAAAGASADTIYHADGTIEYVPGDPAYVAPAPLVEGRSAYVERAPVVVTHPRYYYEPRHYYYERAPFPFSALPWNW